MFDPGKINHAAFSYYRPLRRVRQYVERQPGEGFSLETAARVAGLEEKYFSAFFHSKAGVCFKDWLAHVRITRAMDLMREQDDTITRVALAAGFNDLRTFERAFKRYTGMTPWAFKKSVRPG